MPQKIKVDMNPNRRRKLGYLFRTFREMVNGDDTGYTLVKAGVVIASVIVTGVVVAAFAPYIFAGGILFTGIYVAVALKDEYDRNKAETAKIEQLNNLDADIKEQSVKFFTNSLTPATQEEQYSETTYDEYPNNSILLKYTLRNYLQRLNIRNREDINKKLDAKRKRNGKLPNQNAMIDLIEQVTGFDRLDPDFGAKVRKFLNQPEEDIPTGKHITDFGADFGDNIVKVLGLPCSETDPDISKKVEKKNQVVRAIAKTIKHGMLFVWKTNTAFGLVLGGSILLGLAVAGAAIGWPILVVAGVVGLAGGIAALLYNRYTEKSYRKNGEAIDESTKEKQTKLALLQRMNKLNSKEFKDRNEYSSIATNLNNSDRMELRLDMSDDNTEKKSLLPTGNKQKPQKAVSIAARVRMITHVIAQSIFGLGLGVLVGIAIASVLTVVLAATLPPLGIPLLVVTAAGFGVGLAYGIRGTYMMGKATYKAAKAEAEQTEKAASLKEKYENIVGPEHAQTFNFYTEKSKREVLLALIEKHVVYVEKLQFAWQIEKSNDVKKVLLTKISSANEKLLSLIEQTTSLKRERDKDSLTIVNRLGSNEFYNELALLLQDKDKAHPTKYENLVQSLKISAYQAESVEAVKITNPTIGQRIKQSFSSGEVNTFVKNNITGGVLAFLSIALPLGFLLFSPTALPLVAATVGVVATVYIVGRICNWRSQKAQEKAAEMEQKLPLVERITRLEKDMNEPTPSKSYSAQVQLDTENENQIQQKKSNEQTLRYRRPIINSSDEEEDNRSEDRKSKSKPWIAAAPKIESSAKDNPPPRRSLKDVMSMQPSILPDQKADDSLVVSEEPKSRGSRKLVPFNASSDGHYKKTLLGSRDSGSSVERKSITESSESYTKVV